MLGKKAASDNDVSRRTQPSTPKKHILPHHFHSYAVCISQFFPRLSLPPAHAFQPQRHYPGPRNPCTLGLRLCSWRKLSTRSDLANACSKAVVDGEPYVWAGVSVPYLIHSELPPRTSSLETMDCDECANTTAYSVQETSRNLARLLHIASGTSSQTAFTSLPPRTLIEAHCDGDPSTPEVCSVLPSLNTGTMLHEHAGEVEVRATTSFLRWRSTSSAHGICSKYCRPRPMPGEGPSLQG